MLVYAIYSILGIDYKTKSKQVARAFEALKSALLEEKTRERNSRVGAFGD